jgi:DNA-binding PadR family transcriptional regulator
MRVLPTNQFLILDGLMHPDCELSISQLIDAVPALPRASAYAAITKLQADGRISARWDGPDKGQARRLFKITALGEAAWKAAPQRRAGTTTRLMPQAVQG